MQKYISNKIYKHPFKPIIFNDSKILILGTFPSIKSFENQFYYSHPKNQFWEILGTIFNDKKPTTIKEKIDFLKRHHIALWDTICECIRKNNNSKDDNLEVIKPCDIQKLLKEFPNIIKVAITSRKAEKILNNYFPNIKATYLPSPSPLYASKTIDEKVKEWKEKLLQ